MSAGSGAADASGHEVRIFFSGAAGVMGSHARRFAVPPAIGQTIVFAGDGEGIAVWRVAETGFFAWGPASAEGGTSLWCRVEPVEGAHRAPAGFYDPMAR